MAWAKQHHAADDAARRAQQIVSMRGDRTGIHEPRMRGDDDLGETGREPVGTGEIEEFAHLGGERGCVARIEQARYSGRPNETHARILRARTARTPAV
jgi:hypothetical protein